MCPCLVVNRTNYNQLIGVAAALFSALLADTVSPRYSASLLLHAAVVYLTCFAPAGTSCLLPPDNSPQAIVPPTAVSEMSEMREMLKRQQEQLDQLVGSIAQLQNSNQYRRPPRPGPLICMRCNEPGHFANESNGERVASRSHFPSRPLLNAGRQSRPHSMSEN